MSRLSRLIGQDGDGDDRQPTRPLPARLAAMKPRNRVILALVGILVGVGLMFGGLKLIDDDVNQPASPPPRSTLQGD